MGQEWMMDSSKVESQSTNLLDILGIPPMSKGSLRFLGDPSAAVDFS